MSASKTAPPGQIQTGGVIYTETDNPALLALLRNNSQIKDNSRKPSSNTELEHQVESCDSEEDNSVEADSLDGVSDADLDNDNDDENSSFRERQIELLHSGSGDNISPEQTLKTSLILPPGQETIVSSLPTVSAFETKTVTHNTLLPPEDRTIVTSVVTPQHLKELISPELQNPGHNRFVTSYSSRRLKDHPTGSSVSVNIDGKSALPISKEEKWIENQSAKLRADIPNLNTDPSNKDSNQLDSGSGDSHIQVTSEDINNFSSKIHSTPSLELSSKYVKSDNVSDSDLNIDSAPEPSKDQNNTRVISPRSNPVVLLSSLKDSIASSGKPASIAYPGFGSSTQNSSQAAPSKPAPSLNNLSDSAQDKPESVAQGFPGASVQKEDHSSSDTLAGRTKAQVQRLYVESPSFTREEEDEYRFVSSRIDEYEDYHPTFRGLDEAAVQKMTEGTGAIPQRRKSVKQVHYQDDDDRFEDRDEILHYGSVSSTAEEIADTTPAKQYVLKSKSNNVSTEKPTKSSSQPVRSLTLPSGPSYDPADEEALLKEAYYQKELKDRIIDKQRKAEETIVPRLTLGESESEDFAQDSLDIPEDIEIDSERIAHRNSLDVYQHHHMQQAMLDTQWNDPPPFPASDPQYQDQSGRNIQVDRLNFENSHEMGMQRMPEFYEKGVDRIYTNQQTEYAIQQGYTQGQVQKSQPDPHMYAQHPQVIYGNRYIQQPQGQMLPLQQHYMSEVDPVSKFRQDPSEKPAHYMDRGAVQSFYDTHQDEPQNGFYMTEPRDYNRGISQNQQNYMSNVDISRQFYGNPGYSAVETEQHNPGFERVNEQEQSNRLHEDITPLELGKPPKPSFDFVSNNKKDYGRTQKRTYKKIHDIKKEEKEKLSEIFIQPKLKGKGKDSDRNSLNNSPSRHPAIAETPNEEEQARTAAEQLWAQRSAGLANRKFSQVNGARKKQSSNTSLYSNNSSIVSSAAKNVQPLPPLIPLPPVAANHTPASQQSADPRLSPPTARRLEMKPITQEIITEDGQRISVDVNLRLISPAHPDGTAYDLVRSDVDATHGQGGIRWPGYQYPVQNFAVDGQEVAEYRPSRYSADDALSSKNAGYVSDSHYDYGGYTTNPYSKIPPILSSENDAPRSAPVVTEGGYLQSYIREKEKQLKGDKPWYRVYGLKDYKRMVKEVQLGTLGPDLDNETYREKREKVIRQTEYAKAVREKNTKELMNKKPAPFPRPKEEPDVIDRRKLAVEYAKNVPKPTVKPKPGPHNSYEIASQLSPIAKNHVRSPRRQQEPSVEIIDLEKLHRRHEEDKRSAELIRQKAQGYVT